MQLALVAAAAEGGGDAIKSVTARFVAVARRRSARSAIKKLSHTAAAVKAIVADAFATLLSVLDCYCCCSYTQHIRPLRIYI